MRLIWKEVCGHSTCHCRGLSQILRVKDPSCNRLFLLQARAATDYSCLSASIGFIIAALLAG